MTQAAPAAADDEAVPSPGSAAHLVYTYLRTMERRDLATANAMLAPGFAMVFPGDAHFTRNEDLIAYGRTRYRSMRKRFERFDEAAAADGTVVYCFGTLHGEWPDGRPLEGIRFLDRFTVRDGKLVDQKVWNDVGEYARRGDGG